MGEDRVILDVTFRAASDESLLESTPGIQARDLPRYAASEEAREEAVQALRKLGFEIVGPVTRYGVTIAGSPRLVQEVFGQAHYPVPESLMPWVEAVRVPPPAEFYGRQKMGF